jgi:hypothetical protein
LGGLTLELTYWIACGLLIASAVAGALSVPQFVRSRRGTYYYQRRTALSKAARRVVLAFVFLVVAVILFVTGPRLEADTTPSPTVTIAPATPLPTLAPTSDATPVPTVTPVPGVTRAPTRSPSPLPTVPPPDSPLPSVPAGDEASISFHSLALGRNETGWPEDVGEEFAPGSYTLYLFFSYEEMANGVMRTFAWYREGELLSCSGTEAWAWGDHGFTHYRCPADWTPGAYEVHVSIEEKEQFVAPFVIVEEK